MNKKMNNKGFSLVELIIVIAIMVILVGALAPQFFKYIEKSRQATDVQTAGTVYTVLVTALSDPDVAAPDAADIVSGKYKLPTADGAAGTFKHEVWESLGKKTPTLQSKAYKTHGFDNIVISGTDVTITLTSSESTVPSKVIDASGSRDAASGGGSDESDG